MAVSQEEIGRRLRAAREACSMTQEDVARQLKVSRATVAQMELGNRAVTSLELDKLAYLYGRDIRDFLTEDFREDDAFVAIFRLHPEVSAQEEVVGALRDCVALGREITNLERLLEVDRNLAAIPVYTLPPPRAKWEAVQQGERIAAEERRRLGVEAMPLPDAIELLETQGIRTAQVPLPEDLSGLTLVEPDVGVLVVVNRNHFPLRRRFSYVHEYCHVILGRDKKGTVSRAGDLESLQEVRANAFAASLLMPARGVQEFIRRIAKGRPSRLEAEIFNEEEALRAQARPAPGSQDIQLYDVVLLAKHFGASRLSSLYRLKNLKFITDAEFEAMKAQEDRGVGRQIAGLLGVSDPGEHDSRNEFRRRFLALGLEALRRGGITRRKLAELAAMVHVEGDALDRALKESGLAGQDDATDAMLPVE